MTLKEALELLPSSDFLQVHRSYIVAADKIERIVRDELRIGAHTIPVGANFLAAIDKLIDGAKL
jgi:DNA-binding LytR/AlgR family response regulator